MIKEEMFRKIFRVFSLNLKKNLIHLMLIAGFVPKGEAVSLYGSFLHIQIIYITVQEYGSYRHYQKLISFLEMIIFFLSLKNLFSIELKMKNRKTLKEK